jgi:UDP-glucose 4-epimerase
LHGATDVVFLDLNFFMKHLEARNEVKFAFSDHSRAEGVFGQRRKTTLEDGIRSMAAWVKAHGAPTSGVFKDIEIRRNLPPSWTKAAEAAST